MASVSKLSSSQLRNIERPHCCQQTHAFITGFAVAAIGLAASGLALTQRIVGAIDGRSCDEASMQYFNCRQSVSYIQSGVKCNDLEMARDSACLAFTNRDQAYIFFCVVLASSILLYQASRCLFKS